MTAPDLPAKIEATAERCARWLAAPRSAEFLRRTGLSAAAAWDALLQAGGGRPAPGRLAQAAGESGLSEAEAGRVLLAQAASRALAQAPDRRLPPAVIALLCDEFDSFAAPPPAWLADCGFAHVRFREMARVATLERFPAGQFHWERSGVPRSFTWRAGWAAAPALLGAIAQCRGFAPMLEFHVNERRRNRSVLLESEARASYLHLAAALRLQPEVKGVTSHSWLFCPEIARVTPRLMWLRRQLQAAGAALIETGPAPPESGFQKGSEERRLLYEQGRLKPRLVLVIWPRRRVLRWAASQEPASSSA